MKHLGMGQNHSHSFNRHLKCMVLTHGTAVTWAILINSPFLVGQIDLFVHELTILSCLNPHVASLNQHSYHSSIFFVNKSNLPRNSPCFMIFPGEIRGVGRLGQAPAFLVAAARAPRCQCWCCAAGGQVVGDLRAAGSAMAAPEAGWAARGKGKDGFQGI